MRALPAKSLLIFLSDLFIKEHKAELQTISHSFGDVCFTRRPRLTDCFVLLPPLSPQYCNIAES